MVTEPATTATPASEINRRTSPVLCLKPSIARWNIDASHPNQKTIVQIIAGAIGPAATTISAAAPARTGEIVA
jgi:hypothetical protein